MPLNRPFNLAQAVRRWQVGTPVTPRMAAMRLGSMLDSSFEPDAKR